MKHVVYTSAPAPQPTAKSLVADSHYWTEQALAASTLPGWTVLRNNIYAEIILIGLANALKSGQLYTATGKAGRNYVTREDCAAVAAAALASDFDGKRILDVTGPAPVTQDEIAALASAIAGKTVTHVPLPPDALRQGMIAAGLPGLLRRRAGRLRRRRGRGLSRHHHAGGEGFRRPRADLGQGLPRDAEGRDQGDGVGCRFVEAWSSALPRALAAQL